MAVTAGVAIGSNILVEVRSTILKVLAAGEAARKPGGTVLRGRMEQDRRDEPRKHVGFTAEHVILDGSQALVCV